MRLALAFRWFGCGAHKADEIRHRKFFGPGDGGGIYLCI